MADPARLELSCHVFKLNAAVGLGSWVLRRRPDARVTGIARGSEQIARAWKDELEPELVTLVERVLAESPMASWWDAPRAGRERVLDAA